jgi:hypothetical protein
VHGTNRVAFVEETFSGYHRNLHVLFENTQEKCKLVVASNCQLMLIHDAGTHILAARVLTNINVLFISIFY